MELFLPSTHDELFPRASMGVDGVNRHNGDDWSESPTRRRGWQSATIDPNAETSWVFAVSQRDEEALVELYRQYGGLVYSIAYRVLGNQEDAEEVTQDVFLSFWDRFDRYDAARGSLAAWLAVLARNAAIDRLRRQRRRRDSQPAVSMDAHPHLWETTPDLEIDRDLQHIMKAFISRLTHEQREAIELAYFHGLSQNEVARQLKRPLGTIKSHIRQGMQRLRTFWLAGEAEGVADGPADSD